MWKIKKNKMNTSTLTDDTECFDGLVKKLFNSF